MQFNAGYIPDEVKPNFITPDKTILDFVNPFQDAQNFNPQIQSGGGDPLASAFSNFARKGMSESTMAAPTFYDWKGSNADRYVNTDYYRQEGFDPFVDNESKYGYRQTWGNMIGNAFAGAGKLAWQTFKSGWEGWADMANALFSWDSSKLAGSPEDLKEMYDTQNEIMNKYAIYSTPESQNSIFNKQFFGNMLQQSGFAVGATAQFLSEELLTMGASSALSAGKFAVEGAAFTNRAIKFQEMLRDFTKLGEIWKENRVVDNLLSGAKRLIPLSETGEDIGKAWKALDLRQAWKEGRTADVLKGTAQLGYIGAGGLKRALSEANMSMSEARMEAAGTYGDLNKRLTDEYIAQNGQAPVGADADKIQKMSYKAGLENFWVNSGVLMAMNRIQFDNLFSKFGSERKLLNEMGDMAEHTFSVTRNVAGQETTRVFEKGMFGAAGKFSDIAATFGRRAAAWEATKSAAKGIFKWETSEGVQEILQDLSNNTLQDYYYDLYHGAKGYSYGRSLDRAVKQEESISGAQTFLMGALTGRLLSPFTYGMEKGVERVRTTSEQRNKIDLERKDVISTLNAFYQDPNNFFKNAIANFKGQEGAAFNMQEAVKNRDQYTWQNYKDSALASLISSAKKTGMIDSVLDTIRAYGDHIQGDQLKEAYGIDPTEENIKDTKAYFNSVADRAEEYSKNFDILKDKYGDLINPDLFKEGSAGHIQALFAKRALDDAIEILATNRFKSDRAMDRVRSIYSELQQNKNIGESAALAVHTLASEEEVTKQMSLLKEDLKGLNDNPTKNADIHQQIEYKQAQLEALTNWKDNYSAWDNQHVTEKIKNEAAKDAWQKYVTAKNQEAGLSTVISNDDINDSFEHLAHYTQLNQDHKEYIDAYNTLANPKRFVMLHEKMMDAMNRVRELFRTEHEQELEQTGAAPKNSFTMTGTDDEGKEYSIDINEGDHYVTDANEDKVIFKGKVAKTFNNNLIKILKIDGDNVTIQVNNGKTYEVSKDRLAKAGKLWNLKDMNADARIYFKNRDMVLPINVNSKTGKPHLIKGEFANKDYSKGGVKVNGRLVLQKIDGEQVLKIQYKNPVTGKIETMNYNKEYLLKYGDGKINLRSMPSEEQEQQRKNQERLKKNYDAQLKIFNDRVAEANAQLEQAKVNRQQNEQTFQELRQQLMDDRAELELVKEELEKYEGKKGRKSNLRKSLEENRDRLTKSIADAQAHIDEVKKERDNLDNSIKALKQAQDLYEMAALELMDSGKAFDREGGENLSSNTQDEYDQLSQNQMTSRFNQEQVDNMVEDTQREVDNLNSRIDNLQGYVKDMKEILRRITDMKDFMDFMDLPENVTTRAGLREFLRKKIAEAPDDATREEYQKLMNKVLKGGKDSADILFFLSSMRDSLKELSDLGNKLQEQQDKLGRLQTAAQEKRQLSSLQDRVDFLNQVQQVLIEDKNKVIPVNPNAPAPEGQDAYVTDVELESDPDAPTYKDKKPKFEEVGFNKTFGRHYLDEEDKELNTADGSDRFFAFTGKQNVMGQGYELLVVTEHNDEFGIRQSDKNPDDIKLVVVKKVSGEDGKPVYKYVGVDGKLLDAPDKDNIVYRSMANVNTLSVQRVRDDYTVHESTTDEDIQKKIDEHKEYQKNLVERSKEGPVYLNAVSASPGVQRIERTHDGKPAEAEVEGRVVEDDPDWTNLHSANNPEAGIGLRVSTADGSLAPGVLAGRVVMQEYTNDEGRKIWGDKVTRVFNRLLNKDEKGKVIEALVRLTSLFNRKNSKDPSIRLTDAEEAEYNLIFGYLKNVLPWGGWKNGGNSQRRKLSNMFRIDSGLKRGDFSIPFTELSIRQNADKLLDGVYHNVNNNTLQNNEEFRDIQVKDGKIVPGKSYKTYEEYLLGKRENGEMPPVYTSLPRVDAARPQRTNSYLNWVDPSVQSVKEQSPYQQGQMTQERHDEITSKMGKLERIVAAKDTLKDESTEDLAKKLEYFAKENPELENTFDKDFLEPAVQKLVEGKTEEDILKSFGSENEFNRAVVAQALSDYIDKTQAPQLETLKRQLENAPKPKKQEVSLDNPAPVAAPVQQGPKKASDLLGGLGKPQSQQQQQQAPAAKPGSASALLASKLGQPQQTAIPKPLEQKPANKQIPTVADSAKASQMLAGKLGLQNQEAVKTAAPVATASEKHTDIPAAVEAAQPKLGKLTATVYTSKDPASGELTNPITATVDIPDGRLQAGKMLLKQALMAQIPNEDEDVPYRLSLGEVEQTEDFKALDKFMKENLPQIPVKKVAELIHGKAWGMFKNGAIYIYNNAEIGTGFHEAFEAVWGSYLSDKEQQDLAEEFRGRDGKFKNPFTRLTKNYKDASLYDVREMLAEEFRNYILNGQLPAEEKTRGFFQRLWDFIKRILGLAPEQAQEMNSKINAVFKAIKAGQFKDLDPIREYSPVPEYRAIGRLTQEETARAIQGLNYYFFMELYKNGNNIDALIDRYEPKLSNQILNDIFNKSHDAVVKNVQILGEGMQDELRLRKEELYEEFKKNLSRFGLDFDEHDDLMVKEQNTVNALGIRDSISIDPKKMSTVNVKLLLASLPQTRYNSEGKITPVRDLQMNQPMLVDHVKVHNLLLNELSNIVPSYDENGNQVAALDQMFQKLDQKYKYPQTGNYKEGYNWIQNLKARLRYEMMDGTKFPAEALTADDIRLRIGFIKTFTNVKTIPQKTIVGEDGYIYNLNPVEGTNIERVRDEWSNNLKNDLIQRRGQKGMVKLNPDGTMEINRDTDEYKDLMKMLDRKNSFSTEDAQLALRKLGITFTGTPAQMDKYGSVIREDAIQILEQLKAGSLNSISDIYGSNKIGGRINRLLSIEAGFSGEDNILNYINANGETQYSVGIPSLFSNMINTLNTVKTQKELVQSAPWLGTIDAKTGEVVLHPYQQNSELLKKDGILFDKKGRRRDGARLEYQVISGVGTSDFEGTSTDELQFPERVANKIHYLLQNTVYSNINSDKSTEFGISLPGKLIVSKGDVASLLYFDGKEVINHYVNQLTDEMAAAVYNKARPSNIQYYKDQVASLGHFRDILGADLVDKFKREVISPESRYKGPQAHLRFIEDNRAAIDKAIKGYMENKIDQTVKFLKDLDLFQKPALAGNDLYTTDAIDNDMLSKILDTKSTVAIKHDDGEITERVGLTENDLKTLAGVLALNEEILVTEQHKLIYGHPAFYKDLPKRANGATSTKEPMVDDPDVIKWMDNNMARNDGKQRSSETHQTFKVVSFKDQDVVSHYYQDIAEGMFASMIKTESSKTAAEKKIGAKFTDDGKLKGFITDKKGGYTGLIKAYLELNEADAMAWGMPDMVRDMLFLTGKLSKEQQKQFDYEIAYEKLALAKKGEARYSREELEAAKKIVEKGNPGYVFQVLKPQYFGYAVDGDTLHPVFLKHAVQPKFFRHVEGTQYEDLYKALKKSQVDIIGFESGEKVGNVMGKNGKFTSIYNDKGTVNVTKAGNQYSLPGDLPVQQLYTKFYGIQVETNAKPKTEVVRGTQVTKLIMVNYFENGKPVTEQIGKKIQEYNNTLKTMMQLGKQNLIKELGLRQDEQGNYHTEDLTKLVKTLRREAESRDLPDNMIQGIDTLSNEDGSTSLKYRFDTLINREKIDNILNSIVDSRVISEKIHGKASVQVASTLYESQPRSFMYLKDGVYTQMTPENMGSLTAEERKTIKMKSSDLKFYADQNGKIQSMEVYLTWPFKDFSPEQLGLKLENGIYKLSGDSKVDSRLLKSLGFRIPTQAMNSIESIQIKGFTPQNNGDMIVVPSEIVGKSGSDFDIDKLNLYLPNYFFNSATKSLEFAEWKGSIENTKKYIADLFDKGHLLPADAAKELDRYIAEENDLLGTDPEDKLLKAIFQGLFSEERLTSEFMDDFSKQKNYQSLRDEVVDSLTKKALQNHFMNLMHDLVQDPFNYRQLVVPNGVDTIKPLADEINALKIQAGTKSKEDEKSFTFLRSFVGNNQIRERYLTAKRMVGIAALHSTFHSMAQVSGLKINRDFATKGIYYIAGKNEEHRLVDIKLTHIPANEDGTFNIGHRTDASGAWVSELISEELSGFVDGAKDPFVFDLNFSMNTAATWFYLQHVGVPVDEIAYFFGQPVLDQYFEEFAKNRAGFKKINDESLTREMLFYKVVSPYFEKITGRNIMAEIAAVEDDPFGKSALKKSLAVEMNTIANQFSKFNKTDLRDQIAQGKQADPKMQIAILMNYLEYNAQAQLLGNFINAISYDNKKTKSLQENMMQVARWEKSKQEGFVANPDAIMDHTFLGEMKKQKEDIFKMFKNFFITLSPSVQKAFEPMENKINDPDFFASKDNTVDLLNRYQNFVISYLLHTTPFQDADEQEVTLNKLYRDYFLGDNSMAKILQKYKNSSDPYVSGSLAIQELLPVMSEDTTRPDNIRLFRNKLDTYQINNIVEDLDNLKAYAMQVADSDLEHFVDNLAKFTLVQSGMQGSRLDYRKILSTQVYSSLVKNIIDAFEASGKELDPKRVWKAFHQNNWSNNSVVPKVPNWLRPKEGKLLIKDGSSLLVNDYLMKYVKKPGISRQQLNEMRRNKTMQNAFEPILYEKRNQLADGKWVYAPVNKLGDGTRFTEIYDEDKASILQKNGDVGDAGGGFTGGYISVMELLANKTANNVNVEDNSYNSTTPKTASELLLQSEKQAVVQQLKDNGTIEQNCS